MSLFIVGNLEATFHADIDPSLLMERPTQDDLLIEQLNKKPSDIDILHKGEIMGYHVKEIESVGPRKDPVQYDLLIRYNKHIWYCELKPQGVNNLKERDICDKVDFIFPRFKYQDR